MTQARDQSTHPARTPVMQQWRWMTGALGAAMAISLTGLAGWLAPGASPALPWLVASMGASTVLIFMVPASPLAQPWPVAGGHLLAATMGLLARDQLPEPWLVTGLAVGLAIAGMSLLRCLHPPAGGTALIATLSAPGAPRNWQFLLSPLAINLTVLLVCGLVWHRLTGHTYPHRPAPVPSPAAWAGHIEDADLDAVLAGWDEQLDVSRDDLLALIHAAEARVLARFQSGTTKP